MDDWILRCFEDVKGRRTRVDSERLVSMRHKHLAAMRTTWQAENWSGQLEVRSFLDGDVTNSGVKRYENLNNDHLETVEGTSFCPHCLFLKSRTNQTLVDIQGGTTPEGIHLGAMAGTVELIQRCYSGIETRGDVLWFNPSLPDELTELHFDIRFRGHSLAVDISRDTLTVSSNRCREIPALIGFGNERFELEAGNRLEFKIGG